MDIIKQINGNVILTDNAGVISKVFINVNSLEIKGTDEVILKYGFNQWHSLFASQIDKTQVEPALPVTFSGNAYDLAALLSTSFFFELDLDSQNLCSVLGFGNVACTDIDMAANDIDNVDNLTVTTINGLAPGTVSSVGLSMPSAFNVANSPVTGADTINVTGAGLVSQYIRGDGSLANFPTNVGGGSSVSYYLNGSVNQGTFGGNVYHEMNKTPILGSGTNFTLNADGYIAQFITDAGDPALLSIPSGNWDFQLYLSASSTGGNPKFYTELYKYDGASFTLISSGSASPEDITNGTNPDVYVSTLAVPATTLTLTDRLAIRVYVLHSGRTITLYTEDNKLAEVHTTFSTGIAALNGLTAQVQSFATGTTGTDFGISSTSSTHTFNLPTASATNRGLLSTTDWSAFNGKQAALVSGTNIKTVQSTTILGSGDVTITDSNLSTSDITTNNVSTTKHGFAPKANSSYNGGYLEINGTSTQWVGIVYTVELIDALTVNFYAPYDLKINTVSNVLNSPTTTIQDDNVAYTLTNTIAAGSKITVTVNTAAVVNLNITKA